MKRRPALYQVKQEPVAHISNGITLMPKQEHAKLLFTVDVKETVTDSAP